MPSTLSLRQEDAADASDARAGKRSARERGGEREHDREREDGRGDRHRRDPRGEGGEFIARPSVCLSVSLFYLHSLIPSFIRLLFIRSFTHLTFSFNNLRS